MGAFAIDATSGVTDASAARHQKLVHAAQQFEAVMLSEMMKPLSEANSTIGSEEGSNSTGAMQGYGVEAVAGALAKTGALGFAKRIVASVEKHSAPTTAK